MNIRLILATLILFAIFLSTFAQTPPSLNVPPEWTVEKFKLPPSFAPKFPFTGDEEAIFSPEWARKKTPGYWSYCFRWTLTGYPTLDRANLENALRIYYTNLVVSNLKLANIDPGYMIPVEVKLQKSAARSYAFTGKVHMLDYMTQDPITLNIRVKQLAKHTLFFELSPRNFSDKIWVVMDGICRWAGKDG